MPPPPDHPHRAPSRLEFGHLLGLTAFAVAQPILDLIRRYPEFLVAHGVDWMAAGWVVTVLVLGVPLVLLGLEGLAGLVHPRLRRQLHRGLVAGLAAVVVVPPLGRVASPAVVLLGAAAVAILAWATQPSRFGRGVLALVPLAAPIFAVLFLTDGEVGSALNQSSVDTRLMPDPADGVSSTPVVVVVLDALPLASLLDQDQRLDAQRFPNLAQIAADGIWFRNHTAVADETVKALPAILSGLSPPTGVPDPGRHNLFTLLRDTHTIHAHEAVTGVCPRGMNDNRESSPQVIGSTLNDLAVLYAHLILHAHWSKTLARVDQGWRDFAGFLPDQRLQTQPQRMTARFRAAVADIQRSDPPGLHVIHVLLPHDPFVYLPSGRVYSRSGREPSGQDQYVGARDDDDWAALHSLQRHLLQLGFADRLLGELIDHLEQGDLYDETLLVVTADHGASFRPRRNGRRVNTAHPSDILLVPLVLKLPGGVRAGEVNPRPAQSTDLVPTLVDALGLTIPWEVDGSSLLAPTFPERPTLICYGKEYEQSFAAEKVHALSPDRWRDRLRGDDLLHPGPHGGLVGTSLTELARGEPQRVKARLLGGASRDFDPGSDWSPVEVTGVIEPAPGEPSPWLVVTVNDRVGAVTRAYAKPKDRAQAVWSALLPESLLRPGMNRVALMVLDHQGRLSPVRAGRWAPSFLGQRLGRELVVGVDESGFHKRHSQGRDAHRWTDGAARLTVPLGDDRPTRLRLELNETGAAPAELELLVNDQILFRGPVGPERWERSFPLELAPETPHLTVDLLSSTFQLDGKPFGVAVRGLWLE